MFLISKVKYHEFESESESFYLVSGEKMTITTINNVDLRIIQKWVAGHVTASILSSQMKSPRNLIRA